MPSKIRVLDEKTINKIAAGEVIENSASCVKELVENALDAGASLIEVEILAGGRNKLLIRDNGSGMNPDDALLALERHATSKLSSIEDMHSLDSMGFRGEALASMASISKLTLKTSEGDSGFEVRCHGGKLLYSDACAHKKGTSIELKSLFYNVPARRAFQKSVQQDVQEVNKTLMHLSLAYPEVGFRFVSEQELIWETHPPSSKEKSDETLLERLEKFYGKELTDQLIPIEVQEGPLKIRGWLGPLTQTRSNRSGQLFFLNRRLITSKLLSLALESGYGTRLAPKRFPFAFLFLSLDPGLIDVNVHPQKKEVRFSDPLNIKSWVTQAVDRTLSPPSFSSFACKEEASSSVFDKPLHFEKPVYSSPLKLSPIQTRPVNFSATKEKWIILPHLVGIFDRYFIVEAKSCKEVLSLPHKALDGLLLIDQRRAKERVFFDYLVQTEAGEVEVQNLLFPETLEFSLAESLLIQPYIEELNSLGVGIRSLKGTSFLVDALPAQLETTDVKNILTQVLEELELFGKEICVKEELRKRGALAITQALRFEKKIEGNEPALFLVEKLLKSKEPWISPKGKAIIKCWDHDDLSKLFNRTEK